MSTQNLISPSMGLISSDEDKVNINLEGSGVETIEKWEFRRLASINGLSFTTEERATNVNATVIHKYKDNKLILVSVDLSTFDTPDKIAEACDRLIDIAVKILGAGEDLKLVIREAKEDFLDSFKRQEDSFHAFTDDLLRRMSEKHTVPAVSMRPDGRIVFFNENLGNEEERL